jgi:23S rRNA (cytidine1920-2'-O)/16S rRNA (cytidine1409-2'-O)-methyltransferase
MSRLDRWLRDNGYFSSRQTAKRAIKQGLVLVNGTKAKPSKHVTRTDEIHISEHAHDLPLGYLKLKEIDQAVEINIISPDDYVLDIGSSAGGFILYAKEQGASVLGIEISDKFLPRLKELAYHSEVVSILGADAFTMPLGNIPCGDFNAVLIDVTTEPRSTLKLVQRFYKCLRPSGKILVAFKSDSTHNTIETCYNSIEDLGFADCQSIVLDEKKQEFHVFATKPESTTQ